MLLEPPVEGEPGDELARLREELKASHDRLLRLQADFDNFRIPDFFWVVLQLAHGCADLGFKIGLVGSCHAANSVGLEVFPDQFVWITVGGE